MIEFERVTLRYPDAERPVLRDVSVTVPDGDFCLVIGRTGCGKSSLLGAINGLVPHFTGGELSGSVRVAGRSTAECPPRELADVVGYVGQVPAHGFVTDVVEEEIAYGLEQLGVPATTMRKRVEEALDLLGIADLRQRPLTSLSGGQQQRVAIAAVLAAQPRVLVLDEPTSALDPTAAQDVLAALTTLVHDLGLTVVLAEHRLERVTQAVDSVLWLPGDGRVDYGPAAEVLARADLRPPLAELAASAGWDTVPLSVREARRRVVTEGLTVTATPPGSQPGAPIALDASRIDVRYGAVRAVSGVDLSLVRGTVTGLMGRNGSGKSSLLWALAGALRAGGSVRVGSSDVWRADPVAARRLVTLVPQTASDLLYLPTVSAECSRADEDADVPPGTTAGLLNELATPSISPDADPRDLSEGQRLMLVLAIQLAPSPAVLLLDEPTRGLDYSAKRTLSATLSGLASTGTTVLISTHDVEFAATACHRIVVMAAGEMIADGEAHALCTSSPVYAPQMAKVFAPAAVLTPMEVAASLTRAGTGR